MATDAVLALARPRRALISFAASCLAAWGLLAGMNTGAVAQQVVERIAKGPPGKDIRIGVFINLEPDCTSGPLPAIRVISKPTHGTVTVKRGRISGTNYKHCVALEVPGRVAFYRSKPGFTGVDAVTIEVRYPGIPAETQRIKILISEPPAQEI
ncbi:hypothetical protein [Bradyrhizobium sp. SYSU BS000235]|uniref:hypothetical protein n=1 Tax=Bradyrhizobium sp. SYSU BS000235 TaxID=3411332 RepID=UPI003C7592FC